MSFNPDMTEHMMNQIFTHMNMQSFREPILYSDEQLMRYGGKKEDDGSVIFYGLNKQSMFRTGQLPFTGSYGGCNGYVSYSTPQYPMMSSSYFTPLIPVKQTVTHVVIGTPQQSNQNKYSSYSVPDSQVSSSQQPNTNQPKSYPIEPGVVHLGKPVTEFSKLSQEYQDLITPTDPKTKKKCRFDEFRYHSSRIHKGESQEGEFQVYFNNKPYDEYLAWLSKENQQTSPKESSLMTVEQFFSSNGLKLIMESFRSRMRDDEDMKEMIKTLKNGKTYDNELKENLACIISGVLMTIAYSDEFMDYHEIVSIRNILDKRNTELAKKFVTIVETESDLGSDNATSKEEYDKSYKGVKTYKL